MSIWSKLFGSNGSVTVEPITVTTPIPTDATAAPEIPEETFIEKSEPEESKVEDPEVIYQNQDNIHLLYKFLSKDFQTQGYEDALVNPDTAYMNENIDTIIGEFDMLIRRCKTFYEDAIMELTFLIESRSRLGMVDTVDELKMRMEKAKRHMEKVVEMETEVQEQKGSGERIIVSYKKGFKKGMAAIAHHESNRRKY